MADIFGGVEPPAWLQRLTTPSEPGMLGKIFGELVGGFADSAEIAMTKAGDKQSQGIDTNWIKELPGSIKPGLAEARLNIQNPLWKMQAQQAQLNMAEQGLRIQNEQTLIDARKTKLRMQEHDQDVLPKWLQDHPTWESRQTAEPPNLFTTESQRMFRDVQLSDAANVKHRAVTSAVDAYAKQVGALEKLDPIAAAQFAAQIGKIPTPEMQTKLSDALGAAQKKSAESKMPQSTSVKLDDGRTVQMIFDGKNWKELKADKQVAPKLSEGQRSEISLAKQRVHNYDLKLADPLLPKKQIKPLSDLRADALMDYYSKLKKFGQSVPGASQPAPAVATQDPLGLGPFTFGQPQDNPPAGMIYPPPEDPPLAPMITK